VRRGKEAGLALTLALLVSVAALLTVPGFAGAKGKILSSGPINLPIPNDAPTGVFSPIAFGKKGTVKDINVGVRISHPNVGQINLYLFKGEKYVPLATTVGTPGNDFGSGSADCNGVFTVFDGAAPTFIQTGAPPFNGAYRPQASLGLFDGDQSKGKWRLFAYDATAGTSGNINCWVLGINYKKKKK
jgi:subtilisin-like proprotein convertase family protein